MYNDQKPNDRRRLQKVQRLLKESRATLDLLAMKYPSKSSSNLETYLKRVSEKLEATKPAFHDYKAMNAAHRAGL